MPFGWNQHFVGRQEELLALASALRKGNTAALVSASEPSSHPASSTTSVAATGIGGVGKSQLAAAFVHYFGQYFLGGVFWISFIAAESVAAQVASCAEKMDDLPLWVHQLPPAEQLPHVRRAWQEPLPRLLIFDNCEDPALLQEWQPSSGGCHILLTSRRNRWNSASGLTTVAVATLPRSQSVELLQKHRPTPTLSGWETPLLEEIAGELGDLPLALHMAGSYLHLLSPDLSPQHYLRELRRHDLLDHESMQSGDFTPTGHELHVARTFALSLRQLQRETRSMPRHCVCWQLPRSWHPAKPCPACCCALPPGWQTRNRMHAGSQGTAPPARFGLAGRRCQQRPASAPSALPICGKRTARRPASHFAICRRGSA